MDAAIENAQNREKKSWWESRTTFQRNCIVGVVAIGIIGGLAIPLCMTAGRKTDEDKTDGETGSKISVIIIGSGPAGIAAAAKLLENNITNVTILEAENRIGGRIQSVHFGDAIVDLGAEWCHGESGNTVYELANPLNLLEPDPFDEIVFYHSSQKYLDRAFVQQIQNIATDIFEEPKDGIESSLGEYILQRFNTTITENYGTNPKKVTLAHEVLNSFQLGVLSEEGAFSWFDVAAETDYVRSYGRDNLGWKGQGYKTILDVITKKYPDPSNELPVYENIILKKDVTLISLNEDLPLVRCSDNTSYEADHVIWTPSLGVLKHRHAHLFEPELPKEKVHAIETLGFSAVMKVFFHFSQPWWPKHVDLFVFIWSMRDGQNVWKEFPYGSKTNGRSWLLAFSALLINRHNPNVLSAWICGEAVPSIEKLHDNVIINGTMFLLDKFLGHQFRNLTRPDKIIREKWYANDHFRGTYSYDTLESRAIGVSQREILSTPVKNVEGKPIILFAGEATNQHHFGTVHGAIETGQREANRIIDYYKTN